MYYEQIENKLNLLFQGIESAYHDSSSRPLPQLKGYFSFLISQPIFSNFIEVQKEFVLSEDIDARYMPAFAFLWLAFYSACTKRDYIGAIQETDPVGCRLLERCGLFPLTWIHGSLIAMFQTHKPYEWGQNLREDGVFQRLENLHYSALEHVHSMVSDLEKLRDSDRYVMKHLALRDDEHVLLLNEIFPAHFKVKRKLSRNEYTFLNVMLGYPQRFTREELAPKVSDAVDVTQAKDKVSSIKKQINAYCDEAGLTPLIVGKSPYTIAVLSPR